MARLIRDERSREPVVQRGGTTRRGQQSALLEGGPAAAFAPANRGQRVEAAPGQRLRIAQVSRGVTFCALPMLDSTTLGKCQTQTRQGVVEGVNGGGHAQSMPERDFAPHQECGGEDEEGPKDAHAPDRRAE